MDNEQLFVDFLKVNIFLNIYHLCIKFCVAGFFFARFARQNENFSEAINTTIPLFYLLLRRIICACVFTSLYNLSAIIVYQIAEKI